MKINWLMIGLKASVSVLLIAILLRQIGGVEVFADSLSSLTWEWCALAVVAATLHIILSGFNIWVLLMATGTQVPLHTFMGLYVYSFCFGLILPGQAGDAVITIFLKQRNIPISTSGAAYLIDKIITFTFMLAISAYGFHMLIPQLPLYVSLTFLVFIFIGSLCVLKSGRFIPSSSRLLRRIKDAVISLNETVAVVLKKRVFIVLNVAVTIVKWGLMSLSYYFVFRALGEIVEWPMVGVIPIMASFVGYIPVSIAGVGTVEYSAVYLFSLMGVSTAVVLAAYFVQRLMQYSIAVFMVAVVLLCRGLGWAGKTTVTSQGA